MKIYVAGKFEEVKKVNEVQQQLNSLGHIISYDWTTHKPIKPYSQNQKLGKMYQKNELQAIAKSDVFIYLAHEGGTTLKYEIGAAIMSYYLQGKPQVFVVGEPSMASPWNLNEAVTRVPCIDNVLETL